MATARSNVPTPRNEDPFEFRPDSTERMRLSQELSAQMKTQVEIPLIINGERVYKSQKASITCPHKREQVLAHVHQAETQDVKLAIESNLEARKNWAEIAWEDRAAVFLKAADLLTTKYRYKVNAATMLGQSKTCHQSEIEAVCELADFLRFNAYFAQNIYSEQPLVSPAGQWNRSIARGLEGFVYAIAPFNFTAISVNLATAPAMMGCSVLWKPSHTATLASFYMLEILEEAGLPPGVINMVHGDPQTISDVALNHKELSGVHFTGSTNTFDHLWQEVGKNLKKYRQYPRVVGETGGKDFIFAHESANEEQLMAALIRGAYEYQGQKCSAASRAYIPKSLWKAIKPKLIELIKEIKMGSVEDFSNFMAAVIDERAYEKIKSYIEEAKKNPEIQVLAGGECSKSEGYFIAPTLLEASNPKSPTMVEEIFGPVLTVYVYDEKDFDKQFDLIDSSTPYALTGAIFAQNRHVVDAMSQRLNYCAGNFYINDKPTGAVVGQQPFGGSRRSGTNDKAGSILNLLRWVSFRSIKENFFAIDDYKYPFMGE